MACRRLTRRSEDRRVGLPGSAGDAPPGFDG
jgi:hypothetical protein